MIEIRECYLSDNEGLLELTSLTPMKGQISIRNDRYPDFFRILSLRSSNSLLNYNNSELTPELSTDSSYFQEEMNGSIVIVAVDKNKIVGSFSAVEESMLI